MTRRENRKNLYDPRNGGVPILLSKLAVGRQAFEPARTNYFSIYLIESGSGLFWADASRYSFAAESLLFFVPYQHIRILPSTPVDGSIIQFHANFLCVETFHAEVGCSGVLFNDPGGVPAVRLNEEILARITALVRDLHAEQSGQGLAFHEVMLAQVKVLLILASRLKGSDRGCQGPSPHDPHHPLLMDFRGLIEENYRSVHSPTDYAKLLHVTPKTLGRIVREHLGTTPTELIRARILTHSKWQLLHTLKPVKQIAWEVGFSDELYFSRLFKKATGYSPTFFRDFETTIRGGSNLSMPSSHKSIPGFEPEVDTTTQESSKSKSTRT